MQPSYIHIFIFIYINNPWAIRTRVFACLLRLLECVNGRAITLAACVRFRASVPLICPCWCCYVLFYESKCSLLIVSLLCSGRGRGGEWEAGAAGRNLGAEPSSTFVGGKRSSSCSPSLVIYIFKLYITLQYITNIPYSSAPYTVPSCVRRFDENTFQH